jgi:DNA-binding transcriptional MerR regulator
VAVVTYSLRDAARILKVSRSRLRYWERTALVKARAELHARPAFEFRDLVCLKAVLSLVEQGIPLQRIRRNVEVLRRSIPDLDEPVGALRLWAEGSRRVVVRHDGVLLEPDGQLVLEFGGAQPEGRGVAVFEKSRRAPEEDAEARQAEAIECFERGCELDADPATYAQAEEAYRRGLEADPELADCHCNLGAVLYNQGRKAEARVRFERCLELEPSHLEASFNLANLCEEEGRDDLALRHYRTALESDPLYADVHVNLALLYEKLGHAKSAREHWRRYLQLEQAGAWSQIARQRLQRD